MKNLLLLLICIISSINSYSQFSVKGTVKTSAGIPIANVRVTLFNAGVTIFFEKRTNVNGKFTINNVSAGSYTIGIAALGKEYEESPLNVSGNLSGLTFNLDDESQTGNWDVIIDSPEPLGGTDLGVLLPDGKIFYCHNTLDPFVFDPGLNNTLLVNGDDQVQGCVGPVLLPDGKIIFAGGTEQEVYGPGTRKVKTYDPVGDLWEDMPNMLDYRWYPTIIQLPDNRLLISGGGGLNNPVRTNTSEIYDPADGTSQWVDNIALGNEVSPNVLLYNGKVLMTHRPPQLFDPSNNQWTLADDFVQGNRTPDGNHADHELVLLPEGQVVSVGYNSYSASPGNFIEFYDPVADSWSLGDNFSPVRSQPKALLTPDKKIFVIAGYKEESTDQTPTNQYGFMNLTDSYDPYNGTWRRLDNMNYQREYHALAILVPDGRIIVAGGEGAPGNEPPFSVIEAFTPPYLLRGVRPEIKNLTSTDFSRGETINFKILKTKSPTAVILMSNAVVTHFMNSGNNRYVELPFVKTGNQITATLPADAVSLPDGYYMLYVMVDDIPSVAKIIRIEGNQLKLADEASKNHAIKLFPNPTHDFIQLTVGNELHSSNLKISVENALGKTVRDLNVVRETSAITISTGDLAAGIYFIRIFDGKNFYNTKFIKN